MLNYSVKVLNDVRYIPEVKKNLISLGSLERKGCCLFSSGGKMMVKKGDNVVMTAERRGAYITSMHLLLKCSRVS